MATKQEQLDLVQKLRKRMGPVRPVGIAKLQAQMAVPAPARGGVWISQDVFNAPSQDSDLVDVLYRVIDELGSSDIEVPPRESVTLVDVPFEWIGRRKNDSAAGPSSSSKPHDQAGLPDDETYRRLSADAESDVTILYAHGGAFYMGSPTYSRPSTTKLAKLTKARVVSVAYRVAPQNPFPAALLDLLMAWLSLIYPAPGARYAAVPAKSVVFAGDSAGGNLVLALLQAILRMQDINGGKVLFNGKSVHIPLPAGLAVLSPWVDLSFGMPSWMGNAQSDWLHDITPALSQHQLPDEIWPTKPPRGDPYSATSAWLHPLVCPTVAESWKGSPPLWMAVGEERCADGAKIVATRAARDGVSVRFSEYVGLPHIFPIMMSGLPQSQRCYKDWASSCLDFGRNDQNRSPGTCRGVRVLMPGDKSEAIDDIKELSHLSRDQVIALTAAATRHRKPWTGSSAKI